MVSIFNGLRIVDLYGRPGYGVSGLKPLADSLSRDIEGILCDQRGTALSDNIKMDSTTINPKKTIQDLDDLYKNLG